jgi:hypothetical protein
MDIKLTFNHESKRDVNKRNGVNFIRSSLVVLFALTTVFYSRIFTTLTPAPSALNFFHFISVPFACGFVMTKVRGQDKNQLKVMKILIVGIFGLLCTMLASAILNDAGIINVVLYFLMLGEPFLILLAVALLPSRPYIVRKFRKFIIVSCFINLVLAFIQFPLIEVGVLNANGLDGTDGMAGVFFFSVSGGYVSATVSMFFAFYFLKDCLDYPIWLRWFTLFLALFQVQLSDSKQIILVFFLAFFLLTASQLHQIKRTLLMMLGGVFGSLIFNWGVQNLSFLSGFKNYMEKDGAYGSDGLAIQIKLAPFRIIPTHYESSLNWLLGLGPCHTVDRFGGWLLKEYSSLLQPLGATIHPVSQELWKEVYNNWLAMESTVFSPFFGWAGIWGNLGFLGLCAYLFLGYTVWCFFCADALSKFFVLSIGIFGLIFTQMEEPGFMIFTTTLIGLRWQEHRLKSRKC